MICRSLLQDAFAYKSVMKCFKEVLPHIVFYDVN